jgi:hypothetical protein
MGNQQNELNSFSLCFPTLYPRGKLTLGGFCKNISTYHFVVSAWRQRNLNKIKKGHYETFHNRFYSINSFHISYNALLYYRL